jgi:hypothetical protein
MTRQQILWASRHDWYICLDPAQERAIIVRKDDETGRVFDDYQALRLWAGY